MSTLAARRNDGVYAFVAVAHDRDLRGLGVVATMREAEALTLVLPEADAERHGLEVLFRCAWLTLDADTSLELVGLTARFATALAAAGIACNVVAGARHDHLFVPVERADEALSCLVGLPL